MTKQREPENNKKNIAKSDNESQSSTKSKDKKETPTKKVSS